MPDNRKGIPRDHPLGKSFRDIDRRRVKADLDDIFEFGSNNLERDDVKVVSGSKGAGTVKPSGHLPDNEFETFTEQAKESEKLGWDPMNKTNFARGNKLSTPRPVDVHLGRSDRAARQDMRKKAPVTTDPEKYASDPSHYDFPFVDTPREFRDRYEDERKPFEAVQRDAGEDNLFEW